MARGRRRNGRDISGVVLLDKPGGVSSNRALQRVRSLFQANKAGHTGSLDPIATGLLPVCLGESTKLSGYLLDADKQYRVVGRLGQNTETGDREGAVISEAAVPDGLTVEGLDRLVKEHFLGEIEQIPPMYSALKRDGVPLYEYARRGEEVERKKRTVTIHTVRVLALTGPEIEMEVHCSKGTYIRTLVEDFGAVLGCGAHVQELRRTGAGGFSETRMVTMEALESTLESGGVEALDQYLLPVDAPLAHWPEVRLSELCTRLVRQGQSVQISGLPAARWVRLGGLDPSNETYFLGIGEVLGDGRVAPRRLIRSL